MTPEGFFHSISCNPSQFTQLSCVLFSGCTFGHTLVLKTFHLCFPVLVNHAKWNTFVINVESQWQGIIPDIVHGCSGVTYPYLMKQDFFSLRLVYENGLFYF